MKFRKLEWLKKISKRQFALMCLLMIGIYFLAVPTMRHDGYDPDRDLTNMVGSMGESYTEVVAADEEVTYTVFLMHESGSLVKTEIELVTVEGHSSVAAVFAALQVGAEQPHASVEGLIPASAVLREYTVVNDALVLNLSESFLYYRTSIETDLLASLVWSMTELSGINRVHFQIDGEPVNNFNSPIDVGRGLTRAMGINVEVAAPRAIDTQMMLLYFFTDDSDALLVPVTRLVATDVDPFEYAVSSLVRGPIGANYISVFNHRATLLEQPKLENGIMTLNFCSELFFDLEQTQVSSQVIKQLVMTMTEFAEVYEVSVVVEGSSRVFDDVGNPITVPVSRNVVLGNQSRLRGFIYEY